MGASWRRIFVWAAMVSLPALLGAQEYVFVFHFGTTATVYRAKDLVFLASPEVGSGAVDAIGIPKPTSTGTKLKIYVIRTDAVVVLEPKPPFEIIKTFALLAPVTLGENSAQLTPDAKRVMVAAGDFLHIFEALDEDNPEPTVLDLGGTITAVAVNAISKTAFVSTQGSKIVQMVDLDGSTPELDGDSILLPGIPRAMAASPNASGIYIAGDSQWFEIDPLREKLRPTTQTDLDAVTAIGFDPGGEVPWVFAVSGNTLGVFDLPGLSGGPKFTLSSVIQEAISPGDDIVYMLRASNGRVRKGDLSSGTHQLLVDPETGQAFPLPVIDMELGPGNKWIYLAFGSTGALARLSSTGNTKSVEVIPPSPPTGIAVLPDQAAAPFAWALDTYGGDRQFAGPNMELTRPLAARLRGLNNRGVLGRLIGFTSLQDGVLYSPDIAETNRFGVAVTTLRVPTTAPFTVRADYLEKSRSTVFAVNSGGEGAAGLSIYSGNYQVGLSGQPFALPFTVLADIDMLPVAGLEVTPTTIGSGIVCPSSAVTDQDGLAEIECNAEVVTEETPNLIDVEDSFGREIPDAFRAKVVPTAAELPNQLLITSSTPILGFAGQSLPGAIQGIVFTTLAIIDDTGVDLTTDDDIFVDPWTMVSDELGRVSADVRLGCSVGSGVISARLNAPGDIVEMIPFTTSEGPPAMIEQIQGSGQKGPTGELLNDPAEFLSGLLMDACGNLLTGESVEWEADPPDGVIFENVFKVTSRNGELRALVRLGDRIGPVMVTARVGEVSTRFDLVVTGRATQMTLLGGDQQVVVLSQAAPSPLLVELRDAEGVVVPNVDVGFSVLSGAVSLSSGSATTGASGQASIGASAGQALGPVEILAQAGDLSVVFHLQVVGRTPQVSSIGFVNGASFAVGFVPGSTGSIFGVGLMEGVDGVIQAEMLPFPLEMHGVKVFVDGTPAPILSISSNQGQEQVNIQVPFETGAPSDGIVVRMENNGAAIDFPGIPTFRTQPGIFQIPFSNELYAAALHLNFTLVRPEDPALPGETILFFVTGLGPTVPSADTNVPGGVPPLFTVEEATVTIDGVPQTVLGSFYAPGLISAYQINLTIAPDTPAGTRILKVTAGGASSQDSQIPIGP